MKSLGIGLLTIAAAVAFVWNLGWLWRALGLPANPASNTELGTALVLAAAIGGVVAWFIGTVVIAITETKAVPENRQRKPLPPTLDQLAAAVPSLSQKSMPLPPENVEVRR